MHQLYCEKWEFRARNFDSLPETILIDQCKDTPSPTSSRTLLNMSIPTGFKNIVIKMWIGERNSWDQNQKFWASSQSKVQKSEERLRQKLKIKKYISLGIKIGQRWWENKSLGGRWWNGLFSEEKNLLIEVYILWLAFKIVLLFFLYADTQRWKNLKHKTLTYTAC